MPPPEPENAGRPVVLLTGASGYVGGRLVPLLERQPVVLRCLTRTPDKLRPLVKEPTQVVRGDVLDPPSLDGTLNDVHTAYYLVHLMSDSKDFETEDREAATNFADAAKKAGVRRMRITDLYFSWWLRPGRARNLVVGGLTRTYVVYAPTGHDLKTPLPVVLALHGATMNGPMMAWFSGLGRKADEAGFIAVYPNGTGNGPAAQDKVDDVGFIDALLDDLSRAYPVDARRVYATGMSNGATMAYRLAAELSDRIAAVAPVVGSVATGIGRPKRPVSVLHFHGTRDEFIPFTGGKGAKSVFGTDYRPVGDSVRAWVEANGCDGIPKTDVLSEGGDGLRVTRKTYGGGRGGVEVALVVIEGGGHTWPGKRSAAAVLGRSTLTVSANDPVWEFFQKHPMT